eukprot:scaffold15235_cov61-Phaeocystis_antarctica.AAC.3
MSPSRTASLAIIVPTRSEPSCEISKSQKSERDTGLHSAPRALRWHNLRGSRRHPYRLGCAGPALRAAKGGAHRRCDRCRLAWRSAARHQRAERACIRVARARGVGDGDGDGRHARQLTWLGSGSGSRSVVRVRVRGTGVSSPSHSRSEPRAPGEAARQGVRAVRVRVRVRKGRGEVRVSKDASGRVRVSKGERSQG